MVNNKIKTHSNSSKLSIDIEAENSSAAVLEVKNSQRQSCVASEWKNEKNTLVQYSRSEKDPLFTNSQELPSPSNGWIIATTNPSVNVVTCHPIHSEKLKVQKTVQNDTSVQEKYF